VWAPKTAGSGVAKVKLSFEAWKKGTVTPALVEIPVNPAPKLVPKKP
jgi:hypothetical protein